MNKYLLSHNKAIRIDSVEVLHLYNYNNKPGIYVIFNSNKPICVHEFNESEFNNLDTERFMQNFLINIENIKQPGIIVHKVVQRALRHMDEYDERRS